MDHFRALKYLILFSPALAFADVPVPNWVQSDCPNMSYMNDTHVVSTDLNLGLFGSQKRIAEIQQQYDNKNRDYQQRSLYGTATIYDQSQYVNANSGFGNDTYKQIFATIKQTQAQPYIQNVRAANQRGDFGAPAQYTAGAVAAFTGNPIKTDLTFARITSRVDLMNSNGSLDLETLGAKANISVNPRGSEMYSASFNRNIPIVDCSGGMTYGSTTQVSRFYVNRQIWDHISGEVSKTQSPASSGIAPELSYRLGYGLNF